MLHKLLTTTVLTASLLGSIFPTQAAYIFENENQELERSKPFQRAHFMKKGEFEEFCQTEHGVKATFIPQTIWDLFISSTVQKARYKVQGVSTIEDAGSLTAFQLSCAFKDYLHSLKLTQALAEGLFSFITETMLDDLQSHLQTYRETQRTPTEDDNNVWLHSKNERLRAVRTLLIRACDIEWQAYNNDELLLWRHSRTSLSLNLEGQELQVCDFPLTMVTQIAKPKNIFDEDSDEDKRELKPAKETLGLGCLSYAYSLLGNYINDGTLTPLGSNGISSACTLSYFMAELRDRAFADGKLPFEAVGSSWGLDTPETIRAKLPPLSFISVTRMPKVLLAEAEEWFLPEITHSRLVFQRGEESHPRHRGTIPTSGHHQVNQTLKPYITEMEVAQLAAHFIRQSTPQIHVLNGNIANEQDLVTITKIIEDRQTVAHILCSDNAPKIAALKALLPKQAVIVL